MYFPQKKMELMVISTKNPFSCFMDVHASNTGVRLDVDNIRLFNMIDAVYVSKVKNKEFPQKFPHERFFKFLFDRISSFSILVNYKCPKCEYTFSLSSSLLNTNRSCPQCGNHVDRMGITSDKAEECFVNSL